jgi:hypothetical protein
MLLDELPQHNFAEVFDITRPVLQLALAALADIPI